MRKDINELNIVGTTGSDRRVETKDTAESCQEVVVRYPRDAADLSADERARFASLAAKGLAHLGFSSGDLRDFTQSLWATAEESQASSDDFDSEGCKPGSVVIDGITYVPAE